MAEFCKCGSMVVGNKCTNKNCKEKTEKIAGSTSSKTSLVKDKSKKPSSSGRRSSKCVTYKLSDFLEKENSDQPKNS